MKGRIVELGPLLNIFTCKHICHISKKHKSGQINFSHAEQITSLGSGMNNLVVNWTCRVLIVLIYR